MIIARAPFRVSFCGGGSDLRAYYSQAPGTVLSAAIDSYMYVTVNKRFDRTVRVSYTKTEIVEHASQIQHELVREAMLLTGIESGIEVTTIADVPAGTGLGSSSSLTVALLHALYAYRGRFCAPERLAEEACHIEVDRLHHPIGKQDQYAAAFGGLNFYQFQPGERVFVDPIICDPGTIVAIEDRLLMFYIGTRAGDSVILQEQRDATESDAAVRGRLDEMVLIAREMKEALERNELAEFGAQLDRGWQLKKGLNHAISNSQIDGYYLAACKEGALGGKILGAGGSGFLLLFSAEGRQQNIRAALQAEGLREFSIRLEPEGSKIVFLGGRPWNRR